MSILPWFSSLWDRPPDPPTPPPTGLAGSVSWNLGGGPGEVAFWSDVRDAEQASGLTLAAAMLGRGPDDAPPTRSELPATINPMRFLFENRVSSGAGLVRIKAGASGSGRMSPGALMTLRHLLPPELWLFLQTEASVPADGLADPESPLPPPQPGAASVLGTESPLLVSETGDEPWIRRTESER